MAVVGDAPCQCFSAGEIQTTSPGQLVIDQENTRWCYFLSTMRLHLLALVVSILATIFLEGCHLILPKTRSEMITLMDRVRQTREVGRCHTSGVGMAKVTP